MKHADSETETSKLFKKLLEIGKPIFDSKTKADLLTDLIKDFDPDETLEKWLLKNKTKENESLKEALRVEQKFSSEIKDYFLENLSKSGYDLACDIVKKHPSKYIDLLVPKYEYIANRWGYKKKDGTINITQVANHIRKVTGLKKSLNAIQTALYRNK